MASLRHPSCRKCSYKYLLMLKEPNKYICSTCELMWSSVPLLERAPHSWSPSIDEGYFLTILSNDLFNTKFFVKYYCGYFFQTSKKNHKHCSGCGIKFNGKIVPQEKIDSWYLEVEDGSKIRESFTAWHNSGDLAAKCSYSEGAVFLS